MADFLVFENVTKHFGSVRALDHVSLSVRKGEVFSLLGPSGCGKTTLLRICAGFEQPDSGRVYLDGRDITDLPPNQRRVNTVFQNYALFPHLTVAENIAFGPRVARLPRQEVDTAVARMLHLIQMTTQSDRKPHQISGGQKQRVAIARALINHPEVLLLDEPLAALDLKLRQRMLIELDEIHDTVGITFLYVTHDQGEAMGLSDRIAVMNQGRIEQIGKPAEIYETPVSSFTAAFIGDTNFLDATVVESLNPDYSRLNVDGFPGFVCFNDRPRAVGDLVHISIRPEKFTIHTQPPPDQEHHNAAEGIVEDVIYLGPQTQYWIRVGDHRIAVNRQHRRFLLDERTITWQDRVWLSWHADDAFMLERYRASDTETPGRATEQSP
jgi:spermidine/putrescine transport system ATP-binding protein